MPQQETACVPVFVLCVRSPEQSAFSLRLRPWSVVAAEALDKWDISWQDEAIQSFPYSKTSLWIPNLMRQDKYLSLFAKETLLLTSN